MTGKTALIFPGQGSQSVGMLTDLAAQHRIVGDTFAQASDALGYDLWSLASNGPEERLNQTEITQPAMLTADIATWRVWCELEGPVPDYMAGHSLGEYAALVAAGAIDFVEAVKLVSQRGKLMQEATPAGTGAMAAVLGVEDDRLEEICQQSAGGQVVSCANFNAPGQVVIAGHAPAVERACEAAKQAGARRALLLPVSVPSHCALMKGAADALEPALAETEIKAPLVPVYQNVDVTARTEPAEIRAALAAQLWQPVLWTRTIQMFSTMGVERVAECGPGKVLSGLNRRIAREMGCAALVDAESMASTIAQWSQS